MKNKLLNLQMFAEGGEASGSGLANGNLGTSGVAEEGLATQKKGNGLENVIYGKQTESTEESKSSNVSKAQAFEDLIKGEYKEEFAKRTQGIINERFKSNKGLEETLKAQEGIMRTLAEKYGTKVGDVNALQTAIDEDKSFYEAEALEKGLSVEQLKEMKRLERENEQFRLAQQEAAAKEEGEKIYSKWLADGQEFAERYGIQNFDLSAECQNPEFVSLLRSGINLETAYKAIHMDDMITGAMAVTANTVKQQMANNIASRSMRPSENAISTQNATIFKQDVTKLTKADRDEIDRRVARGEIISF